MTDHQRSVNRLCWHPSDPLVFSASQDGSVRRWDVREPRANATFGSGQSCRDVKINHHTPWIFAAAYDDGTVQLWDTRKGDNCRLRTFTASQQVNQGVLSLAWHPTRREHLATSGVDLSMKIWDLNAGANTNSSNTLVPTQS